MIKRVLIQSVSILLSCLLWTSVFSQSRPYEPISKELYETIMQMDSALFNASNTGNIDRLKTFFTEDLEFFHDAGGLAGYKDEY